MSAGRRAPRNRTTEDQPAYLDREQELAKARWLRDNAEEAAGRLQPGDIRTAARLRHVAEQLIDLLEVLPLGPKVAMCRGGTVLSGRQGKG